MKKVFKYTIDSEIELPLGAVFLHAGLDPQGYACAWFLVNPEQPTRKRKFAVYGTGHEIENVNVQFLSTWNDGTFVWHMFEVLS